MAAEYEEEDAYEVLLLAPLMPSIDKLGAPFLLPLLLLLLLLLLLMLL